MKTVYECDINEPTIFINPYCEIECSVLFKKENPVGKLYENCLRVRHFYLHIKLETLNSALFFRW